MLSGPLPFWNGLVLIVMAIVTISVIGDLLIVGLLLRSDCATALAAFCYFRLGLNLGLITDFFCVWMCLFRISAQTDD